jgi:ATP synthase protein I
MQIANKSQARKVALAQLVMTLVVSAVMGLVSTDYAISALAGGLIATIANAFFSFWVFADYRAQQPNKLVARLYGAEIAKLILVGLLFAGAVQVIDPLSGGALFGVFLCVHLVPGFLSLRN